MPGVNLIITPDALVEHRSLVHQSAKRRLHTRVIGQSTITPFVNKEFLPRGPESFLSNHDIPVNLDAQDGVPRSNSGLLLEPEPKLSLSSASTVRR